MNKSDLERNTYQLNGRLGKKGYDWWWHSFTGYHRETGEEKAFFIEYFIVNPKIGKNVPVFGQVLDRTSPIMPSYVMLKVGAWGKGAKQLHRFFSISDLVIASNKLELKVGDCFLSETSMKGRVQVSKEDAKEHPEYMSDSGEMIWDIEIEKKIPYNVGYGASAIFRKINAFAMYWHVEGMKTNYKGNIIWDGEEYEIVPEKSFGYADKNWGQDFTSPWVWLSSCNIVSRKSSKQLNYSAFDVGGGCPKIFGMPLKRKLLIDFVYEGEEYEFNFSKFWTSTKTEFRCYETEKQLVWEISTQNKKGKLDLHCTCEKNEMLHIRYESPDGFQRFTKLWNGGTGKGVATLYRKENGHYVLLDEVMFKNVGCEYGEYDF